MRLSIPAACQSAFRLSPSSLAATGAVVGAVHGLILVKLAASQKTPQ